VDCGIGITECGLDGIIDLECSSKAAIAAFAALLSK